MGNKKKCNWKKSEEIKRDEEIWRAKIEPDEDNNEKTSTLILNGI